MSDLLFPVSGQLQVEMTETTLNSLRGLNRKQNVEASIGPESKQFWRSGPAGSRSVDDSGK